MLPHHSAFSRVITGLSAAAIVAGSGLLTLPALADDPASYSLSTTVDVGSVARDIALDATRDRAYVPVNRISESTGALTWLNTRDDTASDSMYELDQAEPEYVVASADGAHVYVLHYRSGTISVVDPESGETTTEITGVPTAPSGMVEDTTTGLLYVNDGSTLTVVDPSAGTVSDPIAVSGEAYPLLKDIVYDAANNMLWIAEGRKGVITGYSTLAQRWVDSLAIPITDFDVDGGALGGRPSLLALDPELGHLYVSVSPRLADDWVEDRLVVIDPATGKHLGNPISTGERVYDLAVNPRTHEVISSAGFDNALAVVSPETWDVSQTLDFTELGVTDGTGTANADLWALAVASAGDSVYVTHPYSDRTSVVERTGEAPPVTELPEAPGQEEDDDNDTGENETWDGPEAAEPAAAPDGAVVAQAPDLSWSVNEYMKAWSTQPLGDVDVADAQFEFADGTGWFDEATQRASIAWADGFRIQHYPGLAPDVVTTLGNPRLDIDEDGSGELSFDVAWSVDASTRSEGYQRVIVATFAQSEITVDGDTVAVEVQPDFEGRTYDAGDRVAENSFPAEFIDYLDPAMRAWWFSTGASMDAKKAPHPFVVGFAIEPTATAEPTETDDSGNPGDDGADEGSSDGGADDGTNDDGGSDDDGSENGRSDDGTEADELPRTGAQVMTVIAVSAVLLAIGGAALVIARRRRA
jgi:LPXTG-motif cell wall-anchored protein